LCPLKITFYYFLVDCIILSRVNSVIDTSIRLWVACKLKVHRKQFGGDCTVWSYVMLDLSIVILCVITMPREADLSQILYWEALDHCRAKDEVSSATSITISERWNAHRGDCNRPSAWIFGGPEFEYPTPLHHCTLSGMRVYFCWNLFARCWSFESGEGVQFGELTREGHVPKTSTSVQSRYIAMSAGGFSPHRGSARPLPGLIHRPLLSDSFSRVMNFTVTRTKAVCAPKDKGNLLQNIQATFTLSTINIKCLPRRTAHLQLNSIHCVCIEYTSMYCSKCCLHLATKGKGEEVLWRNPTITHPASAYTHIREPPPRLRYKLRSSLTKSDPTLNPRLVQGYRWMKWAPTVNQATEVYLSLVDPVHWRPFRLDARKQEVSHHMPTDAPLWSALFIMASPGPYPEPDASSQRPHSLFNIKQE
jgi:hypothetical protein